MQCPHCSSMHVKCSGRHVIDVTETANRYGDIIEYKIGRHLKGFAVLESEGDDTVDCSCLDCGETWETSGEHVILHRPAGNPWAGKWDGLFSSSYDRREGVWDIETPFTDAGGELVTVYVRRTDDGLILTDLGETDGFLSTIGRHYCEPGDCRCTFITEFESDLPARVESTEGVLVMHADEQFLVEQVADFAQILAGITRKAKGVFF